MRLLHFYNVLGSGTERAWLEYPLGLAGRGHEVVIGYEQRAAECPSLEFRQHRLARVMVEPTGDAAGQMDRIAERVDDPAMGLLLGEKWDVVHGHSGPRLLQMAPFIGRGVPTVVSLYGYDASRLLRDPSWGARYRWAAERGAVFVVLAESMRRRLVGAGVPSDAVRVIHLGVDPGAWAFEPVEAPVRPRFLFVGRLTAKKNPGEAVAAVSLLWELGVEAELIVAGAGPLEGDVRRAAELLQLGDRVRFRGEVDRAEVARLMGEATALVLPSGEAADGDCEGTPIVLMEAQSRGLVCITTDHAGNREVIAPAGRRFVVGEGDTMALARAMAEAAELYPPQRRELQEAGRAWVEREFSLERTVEEYERLYRSLVGG